MVTSSTESRGQHTAPGPALLLHLQKHKAWPADNLTEEEAAEAKGPAPKAAVGSQPPGSVGTKLQQCRHQAAAVAAAGGTGMGMCSRELMQPASRWKHLGGVTQKAPTPHCNAALLGASSAGRRGPWWFHCLSCCVLSALCPFPGEGAGRAQHSESGAGEERGAHVCAASRRSTGGQTRSAGASAHPVPPVPEPQQTRLWRRRGGMSSLPAPGEWLPPGSQMQQRLEMAAPGASSPPRGAGDSLFTHLCSCWGWHIEGLTA